MPKHNIWVVKVGGSLIGSEALQVWLRTLAAATQQRRIVIVAGGGVFADTVRSVQRALTLSDEAAHRMAIMAMGQYTQALLDVLAPHVQCRLEPLDLIRVSKQSTGLSLWDPSDARELCEELPRNWRVTSDTISLWLAREIAAQGLILLKFVTPTDKSGSARSLANSGFVDDYFPCLLKRMQIPCWWMTAEDAHLLDPLCAGIEPLSTQRIVLR